MLQSYEAIYDHGHIEWLTEQPKSERFKMLVVIEQPEPNTHEKEVKVVTNVFLSQ